jgi:phage terminase small subunit
MSEKKPLSSKRKPLELTEKKKRFVAEYLVDRNQTQAAIRAGYSPKTANEQASRLMTQKAVKAAIRAGSKAQEKRTRITADRVLRELAHIAFLDIRRAYEENGSLKNIHAMPATVARAIAAVETDDLFEGSGQDRFHIGQTKKLKLNDKVRALELLGKYFKMFTDKIEVEDSSGLGALLKEARERVAKAKAELEADQPEAEEGVDA